MPYLRQSPLDLEFADISTGIERIGLATHRQADVRAFLGERAAVGGPGFRSYASLPRKGGGAVSQTRTYHHHPANHR